MPRRECSGRSSKEGSGGLTEWPGFEDEGQQRWWLEELEIDPHADEMVEMMLVLVEVEVGGVGDSFLLRSRWPQKRPECSVAKA